MAYQSGSLPNLFTGLSRRRALTGRSLSRQEMSGLVGPVLDYDVAKANAAGEREQRQMELDRQYQLQKKAQEDSSKAAEVGGAAQLASLGMSGYLGYKGYEADLARAATQKEFNSGLLNAISPQSPVATAPTVVGAGGAGMVPSTGAAGGTAPSVGATLYPDPSVATSAADAAFMAETGMGDAAVEGAGLFAGSGAAVGPAGIGGGIGSMVGGALSDKFGVSEDIGQGVGGALGGALAGAAATSWSGPGALVGAAVGAIVSLFDDIF